MQMHNGYDRDEIRSNPEQNAEGESPGQASSDIPLDQGIELGIQLNAIQGVPDGGEETLAEVWLLGFVPYRGVKHLRIGIRMKSDGLHPSAA